MSLFLFIVSFFSPLFRSCCLIFQLKLNALMPFPLFLYLFLIVYFSVFSFLFSFLSFPLQFGCNVVVVVVAFCTSPLLFTKCGFAHQPIYSILSVYLQTTSRFVSMTVSSISLCLHLALNRPATYLILS